MSDCSIYWEIFFILKFAKDYFFNTCWKKYLNFYVSESDEYDIDDDSICM